jgi:methylated-DNA-[protein]-cysteine S-methyltransferase
MLTSESNNKGEPMSLQLMSVVTPLTPWTVVVDEDGVVVASGFASADDTVSRLTPEQQGTVLRVGGSGPVSTAMQDYLAGDAAALDGVEVRQPGGPFQQLVWQVMRQIPAGQTWSYGQLAAKAGRASATRAVGTACARNLVAPFVPCHRVVRSDGSLGGYAYGLDVKRWLLDLEH